MPTLDAHDSYMVLINTFAVDPDRAEELLEVLGRATDAAMVDRPGFVSANLHMSDDRKHVTNYAQWKTREDYDAMMADPAAVEHMGAAADIADGFEPFYYELRSVHTAP